MRGKAELSAAINHVLGITPARAGKSRCSSAKGKAVQDHPRVGGEKFMPSFVICTLLGSPPHGRGTDGESTGIGGADGITPAWAGKRAWFSYCGCQDRDHPRMGGEKLAMILVACTMLGSPPHGRGKDDFAQKLISLQRITPAWAGKSYKCPVGLLPAWDHPRVGGEKNIVRKASFDPQGSPPRGRGKDDTLHISGFFPGITPAWAGKRQR